MWRAGGVVEAFQADVRDEQQCDGLVAEVVRVLGPIDILVMNATGPQPPISLEQLTWRDCLDQLEYRHRDDPEDVKRGYAAGVPMGRMGEPMDVAEAVAFLASEGARFITGQRLSVNGGNTLA